jgi:hypothetical protein
VTKATCSAGHKTELAALVHQAAVVCTSYEQVAPYVQIAVAKLYGEEDWNVAVTRSLYSHSRTRPSSTAIFAVPALLADVKDGGKPSPELSFTVLLWRCAGDEVPVRGALAALGDGPGAPPPVDTAATAPLFAPGSPLGYSLLSSTVGSETEGSGRARGVSGWAGGAQRSTGLSASTEGAFSRGLRDALTAQCGSTWHVVLGQAPSRSNARASAHSPAFAIAPSIATSLTFSLSPHWVTGSSRADTDRTPAAYHVAAFQTAPGAGQAVPGAAAPSSWGLPSWDGTFKDLVRLAVREPYTALRLLSFTIAMACFVAFLVLAYRSDNACARMKGLGLGSPPPALAKALAEAAAGGVPPLDDLTVTTSGVNGSASVLLPMPAPSLLSRESLASIGRGLRAHWATIGRQWTDAVGQLVGREGTEPSGGDASLPPLPPLPDGEEEEGAPNALAALLGMPARCTRAAIHAADARMLRARLCMYAALCAGGLAVLSRKLHLARHAAVFKATMRSLPRPDQLVRRDGEEKDKDA